MYIVFLFFFVFVVPKSKPSKKSSKVDRILKTSNDYTKENDLKVLNDVNKASELERNCRKESELNFIKKMKDLEQSSVHASSQFENVALMPKHQFDCHVSPSTDENNFSIDIVQECADIMSATTQVSPSPIKETKKINKSTSNRSLFVPSNSHLNPTKEQESAITITKSLVQKEMPAKKLIPTSPTSCTHPKLISTPKHPTTGMKRPKSSIDKTSEERPRVGMKRPRNQPIVADENCEKCKEYIESIIKLQRENSKLKEALEAFQKESGKV